MILDENDSFASLADILDLSKPLEQSCYSNYQNNPAPTKINIDVTEPSTSSVNKNLTTMYNSYDNSQNKINFLEEEVHDMSQSSNLIINLDLDLDIKMDEDFERAYSTNPFQAHSNQQSTVAESP